MSQLFPGKDLENVGGGLDGSGLLTNLCDLQITPNEFMETVGRLFPKKSDLSQWTFGG
jgi:hypothetical protein